MASVAAAAEPLASTAWASAAGATGARRRAYETVLSSVRMTADRLSHPAAWSTGASCHWMGPGPNWISGACRPNSAAALTAW